MKKVYLEVSYLEISLEKSLKTFYQPSGLKYD